MRPLIVGIVTLRRVGRVSLGKVGGLAGLWVMNVAAQVRGARMAIDDGVRLRVLGIAVVVVTRNVKLALSSREDVDVRARLSAALRRVRVVVAAGLLCEREPV